MKITIVLGAFLGVFSIPPNGPAGAPIVSKPPSFRDYIADGVTGFVFINVGRAND